MDAEDNESFAPEPDDPGEWDMEIARRDAGEYAAGARAWPEQVRRGDHDSIRAVLEHHFDDIDVAVIATDLLGTVAYWNSEAEQLYGWRAEEVLGRPITEATVGPEDDEVAERIMATVRASGRWEGDFIVHRKDGSTFLARVINTIIENRDGRAVGLVGVSVDVSHRAPSFDEL
jgi:PAS domain S-box-containing protein